MNEGTKDRKYLLRNSEISLLRFFFPFFGDITNRIAMNRLGNLKIKARES